MLDGLEMVCWFGDRRDGDKYAKQSPCIWVYASGIHLNRSPLVCNRTSGTTKKWHLHLSASEAPALPPGLQPSLSHDEGFQAG